MGDTDVERGFAKECCYRKKAFCSVYWKTIVALLGPIIFCPILIINGTDPKFLCMYIIGIMATCWVTEAIPIAVTGFIPVITFPVLGILNTRDTCMAYLNDTTMMCVGGIMFAVVIEFSNLHNRLALGSMLLLGTSHRRLQIALTLITTSISMWITNAAATAMMCPIVYSILAELESQGICKIYSNKKSVGPPDPTENAEEDPKPTDITNCYYLTAAYSSSIGGIGTLVGTGSNLTLKGIYENIFPEGDISFPTWSFYTVPMLIVKTILNTFWLQIWFMGLCRPNSEAAKNIHIDNEGQAAIHRVLVTKYKDLGPMSFHEKLVCTLFVILLLLFFFRNPEFIDGYVKFFNTHLSYAEQNKYLKDAVPVMFIMFLLFVIPKECSCLNFCKRHPDSLPTAPSQGAMTWKYMNGKFPWGFIFLLGSGFAIASAGKESGMNHYIGLQLQTLSQFQPFTILCMINLCAKILTDLMSNVAVANIMLPIVAEVALAAKLHPLYIMLPAGLLGSLSFLLPIGTVPNYLVKSRYHITTLTMSCQVGLHPLYLMAPVGVMVSHAYMLPVGTPPNAIIREYMFIPVPQMMLAGIGTGLITYWTTILFTATWGNIAIPEINDHPDWLLNYTNADNTSRFHKEYLIENLILHQLPQLNSTGNMLLASARNLSNMLNLTSNASSYGLFSPDFGN